MAILKNNQFSSDDDDTRQARLDLLSANIDTYAVEIGVAGALLLWAQGAFDAWVDARTDADKETGDAQEAYQEFQLSFNAARAYYVNAKELLQAVLDSMQKGDDAEVKYGIRGRTPRSEEELFAAVAQWKKTHDEFTAASDPRVISAAIVAKMVADADAFDELWRTAITENKEARQAFDVKQTLFSGDADNLRLIYQMAKMVWGDDDPKLKELGFVPASEIWTPGQPEPGEPGPGGNVFPEVPENVAMEYMTFPKKQFLISAEGYSGEEGFDVRIVYVPTGMPAPSMPDYDTLTNAPFPVVYSENIQPGMTYYAWVRARNGEEVSDWAGVVSAEVV